MWRVVSISRSYSNGSGKIENGRINCCVRLRNTDVQCRHSGTTGVGAQARFGRPTDRMHRGDGHGQGRCNSFVLHVVHVDQNRVRVGRPGHVRPLPEPGPQIPLRPVVSVQQEEIHVCRAALRRPVCGPARRLRARPVETTSNRHGLHDSGRHQRTATVG